MRDDEVDTTFSLATPYQSLQKKSKMGVAGKAYLVLYNVVQLLGWSHMLYILLPHLDTALVGGIDRGQLYSDVEWSLKIFQTAAVLEVVHAALGLVKTNPLLALFQVTSRVFVAWAILDAVPESRLCRGLPLLLLAWIITEMIRYSFYAVSLLGTSLYLITWLRFSRLYSLTLMLNQKLFDINSADTLFSLPCIPLE